MMGVGGESVEGESVEDERRKRRAWRMRARRRIIWGMAFVYEMEVDRR